MKRVFLLVTVFLAVSSLCACNVKKSYVVSDTLDTDFKLTCGCTEFIGKLLYNKGNTMIVELQKPEELKDVEIYVDYNRISVSFDDVSIDSEYVSEKSEFIKLYQLLGGITDTEFTLSDSSFSEKEINFNGEDFSFVFNNDSLRLCKISGENFSADFFDL